MRRMYAAVVSIGVMCAAAPPVAGAQGGAPVARPPVSASQGTGTVRGVVVTGDEPQPLAGASIRLTVMPAVPPLGMFQPFTVTTTADGSGRFEFTGVPAGVLSLIAEKVGYYNLSESEDMAAQAEMAARWPTLEAGATLNDVTVRMSRAGVITGRVLLPSGEPAVRMMIEVLRYSTTPMGRRLVPAGRGGGPTITDDTGSFRAFGLAPGDYVLAARPSSMMMGPPGARDDTRDGVATTYYPGTASIADARPLTVRSGDETTGVVLSMLPVALASVSGTVRTPAGVDPSTLSVGISELIPERLGTSMSMQRVNADGRFTVSRLAPGRYRLIVRDQGGPAARHFASADVTVTGENIDGVGLELRPGTTVTGRVVTTTGEPVAGSPAMRVQFNRADADMMVPGPLPVAVNADGTFRVEGLFAKGHIRLFDAANQPAWTFVGARLGDRDITDVPLEPEGELMQVTLVVSTRSTEVRGTVKWTATPEGARPRVVVFPEDEARWHPASIGVRVAPVSSDGRFFMRRLPPGDRYLVVAVERFTQADLWTAGTLAALKRAAVPLNIEEGGVVELTLTAIPPPTP